MMVRIRAPHSRSRLQLLTVFLFAISLCSFPFTIRFIPRSLHSLPLKRSRAASEAPNPLALRPSSATRGATSVNSGKVPNNKAGSSMPVGMNASNPEEAWSIRREPSSAPSGRSYVVEGAIEKNLLRNHSVSSRIVISPDGSLLVNNTELRVYDSGSWSRPSMNNIWFIKAGYHYRSKRLGHGGYRSLKDAGSYRMPNMMALPRLCGKKQVEQGVPFLLQFANVWMDNQGRIYAPRRSRVPFSSLVAQAFDVYDIQGGFVERSWTRQKGRFLKVGSMSVSKNITLALSLVQHHGFSFHHVLHEVVPRLLVSWRIIDAVWSAPSDVNLGLVVEKSSVTRDVLQLLGFPNERVRVISLSRNERRFFPRVAVSAPFLQDKYDKGCYDNVTASLLKQIVNQGSPNASSSPSSAINSSAKVVVLLVERARGRFVDSRRRARCRGNRCLTNFQELRKSLGNELGEVIDLRVLPSKTKSGSLLVEGIRQFQVASIAIGVHGAAFQNMMFMRPGSYAIHLGWRERGPFYLPVARRFKIHFINVFTPGARQNSLRARANIDVVLFEVRRILRKMNITVPPSKRAELSAKQVASLVKRWDR